jgi:hypothetical protein
MLRHVADNEGKIISTEEVEKGPICGEDFCDNCGKCLACEGNEPCRESPKGHRWVRYPEVTS